MKGAIKYFIVFLFVFFASACSINQGYENNDEKSNQENPQEDVITVSRMQDLIAIPDKIQLLDEEEVISALAEPQEINKYMEKLSNVVSDTIAEYKSAHSQEKIIIKLFYNDTKKIKIANSEKLEGKILAFNVVDIDNEGLIFLQIDDSAPNYRSIGKLETIPSLIP